MKALKSIVLIASLVTGGAANAGILSDFSKSDRKSVV